MTQPQRRFADALPFLAEHAGEWFRLPGTFRGARSLAHQINTHRTYPELWGAYATAVGDKVLVVVPVEERVFTAPPLPELDEVPELPDEPGGRLERGDGPEWKVERQRFYRRPVTVSPLDRRRKP